ncbi:phosphate ABC transporter substrate-binding protein PstS [Phormidium sp. LEGE 05292]|uniref:phosphate ABC transporter substrate-binding protein PstS n=1 Tax=[Phormidium] sp. LEGE 05292 TaxID=767427 RepID=UPI0018817801|nr:phosphate ABC transporter substrate-binding protein PstS [Phormidium sp. LEGE 05292]MBE9225276.1 phosphate ABC transporter substrate-binding protein PstS [Phormidium sp. LEGE 05292]
MSVRVQLKRRKLLVFLCLSAFVVASNATNHLRPQSATAKDSSLLLAQGGARLTGAGASFPAPLYQRWFSDFNKKNPSTQISYQSVGSGAGVQQLINGTVDFGASDVAMTDAEMAKVSRGVVLIPATAGSVVVGYNLPGVNSLKLSRTTLPAIFLGEIKSWDDPRIAKDNPGVKLPKTPITVVYRADGSGTNAIFTEHLSAISPTWKSKVGSGKSVSWPTGQGAKGNEGVTAQIKQTPGAIGYIEYGYARSNKIPYASLQNKAGNFVAPTLENSRAALASIQLPSNLRAFAPDPSGGNSYPIVTYSWILAYKTYPDANKAKALKQALNYGLTTGQDVADDLGYIPLPPSVVSKSQAAVNSIK